jgi:hypothetical protein
LATDGGRLYAACGNAGVRIWEVTAALTLRTLGQVETPAAALGLSVAGPRAYVAQGNRGWLLLDISAPESAFVARAWATPAASALTVSGTLAFLANGADGLRSVDVSAPLEPVPSAAYGPLVRAMRLTSAGLYAFVAEEDMGLTVVDTVAVDRDQDGLPDAWEQQIIDADPNDDIRTIAEVLPQADFDRDGLTNYEEYLAGTSPLDPASVFAVACTADPVTGQVAVRWHSVPGKYYTLYRALDQLAGFEPIVRRLPATPPLNQFNDTLTSTMAFYLVVVE